MRITTLLALLIPVAHADATAPRPNLVLVLADDMGWRDIGYNRVGQYVETPTLDRLASEGMVFTSAYASAGNCAPSRACLLSGQYTPRHGLYAVQSTERGKKKRMRLVPTPNHNGLTPEAITLAETLQEAGYATAAVGKWHLSGRDGANPDKQGFDYSYNSFGDGEIPSHRGGNHKGPPSDPKGVFDLTDKACEFIRANHDEPFFCYLAHHAVHGPHQARPETLARFRQKGGGGPTSPLYAGCNYDLDASLAKLLECLKGLGIERETLIVFTSDNGATNLSDQEPLRGRKGGYYEGGIRVPMVVRWPGVVEAGSTSDTPVSNIDIYPTFASLAGASPPAGYPLDGRDLSPVLRGEGQPENDAIYWFFPGYLNSAVPRGRAIDIRDDFRSRPVTVMRKGKWKIHLFEEEWALDGGWDRRATSGAIELYDLDADIGERDNLANAEPDLRDALLTQLLAWRESVEAQAPSDPHPLYQSR